MTNSSKSGETVDSLYSSPGEALKKVASEYEYWSGRLTETSLQMCYAIIGANWVLFGSMNRILTNVWAKYSVFMVMVALGTNIIGSLALSETLRKRIDYGENDKDRWKKEFDESSQQSSPWPFTSGIDNVGRLMRIIKGVFTLLAALLMIIGAIRQ